ncbi:MAG: DEAD/DEAH box helicase family protein, partial [Flavobacteriaceae bacterium]|nr:DEAD/DEAH box helicase family protein [Flavobacteriaceae bacterium]
SKNLWDYQQEAVEDALKVLWKYFEDFADYHEGETLEVNHERKEKFLKWYKDNGLDEDLDIRLKSNTIKNRSLVGLLNEYYSSEVEHLRTHEKSVFDYRNFINRMCFWMATGSGKTLIIIKLIRILKGLIDRGEIPPYDILVLTYRDDLIEQFTQLVNEFNYANETKIILKELKDYPEVKRQPPLHGITVFYYRSDNLSDEQKEKIIDFKNYDNEGKWYAFLDEAHKGDREESKRQHIYSILSRNGFLFNSSATFIDPRDIITCAFEFNLSSFIKSGYGKHIGILKQEIRAFRDKEDYSGEEKQKIVLKSLILLTYAKKFYSEITKIKEGLYHKPLLLTLVNSVNTEDADLKLFFRELEKIGKGDVEEEVFKSALDELWEELKEEPEFMFEEGRRIKIDEAIFRSITKNDVLDFVYNSKTNGEIEILRRFSDRKELAFKLKTSDRPFALIKIGDISGWLKNEFVGYEVQEKFEDESYFEGLNREDSDINILMGSRSFYEGWDSNRPNAINFINIGMGQDAKKFILQSTGRGVRIEPVEDQRKRLLQIYNAREMDETLFNKIKDKVLPIETLFIFGTNREALKTVIGELEKERKREGETQLPLLVNKEFKKFKLLIPTYELSDYPLIRKRELAKFEISQKELEILKKYAEFLSDDKIMLMKYNTEPEKIEILRDSLSDINSYKYGLKSFKNMDLLVQRIFDYFSVVPKEFRNLKELDEEIRHFKNVKVYLKDISEIRRKIERVKNYPTKLRELQEEYGKIPAQEYINRMKDLSSEEDFESDHEKIIIKYIANHYYIPLILSETEKVNYIKHIIKTRSEVKFIKDLEEYLAKSDNKLKEFDWWLFSKIDQSLDEVYIPYYNPNVNKISYFYPDFIFWLKKGNDYSIVFIDPKGTEHTSYIRKIDGHRKIFEENGKEKIFDHNGLNIKIKVRVKPDDVSKIPDLYRMYSFDKIENML